MRWLTTLLVLLWAMPAAANWSRSPGDTTADFTRLNRQTTAFFECPDATCADTDISALLDVRACDQIDVFFWSDLADNSTHTSDVRIYNCAEVVAPAAGGNSQCYILEDKLLDGNAASNLESIQGVGATWIFVDVDTATAGDDLRVAVKCN